MQLYQKMKSLRAFSRYLFADTGERWLPVNNYAKLLHNWKKFNEKHTKLETIER